MCVYLYIYIINIHNTHTYVKQNFYFGCECTSNYLIKNEKQNYFDDHTCFNGKHLCYEYINELINSNKFKHK